MITNYYFRKDQIVFGGGSTVSVSGAAERIG